MMFIAPIAKSKRLGLKRSTNSPAQVCFILRLEEYGNGLMCKKIL